VVFKDTLYQILGYIYIYIYIYIHVLKINKGMEKFHEQEHYYHLQPSTKPDNCGFGAKNCSSLIKTQC